jgi:hypothetical protein
MKHSHVSLIKFLVVEELRQLGSDWDTFFLIAGIPKDPKRDFPLHAERVISHCTKVGLEEAAREIKTSEALSHQQKLP